MNVASLIGECAGALERGGVYCGHGTDNPRDEAAWIIFHALALDHADAPAAYRRPVRPAEAARVHALVERRIRERIPAAYLLGEAWFAGLPFHVDPRVLIPRSPFAELVLARFSPWIEPGEVRDILEIGTGSGCIAIACALAFPGSRVLATDISPAALEVAARNVARHGVGDRVKLLEADLFDGVSGEFDLIVTNPPYVPEGEIDDFPAEYGHEPRLALASGSDGLETPARILQHARSHLRPDGLLALEVGEGAAALEARFPELGFCWPAFEGGGDGIALVSAAELRRLASAGPPAHP
jgi:ribosomal protein L3 glutamine methyltransferase